MTEDIKCFKMYLDVLATDKYKFSANLRVSGFVSRAVHTYTMRMRKRRRKLLISEGIVNPIL